jgi:hypothetical protein
MNPIRNYILEAVIIPNISKLTSNLESIHPVLVNPKVHPKKKAELFIKTLLNSGLQLDSVISALITKHPLARNRPGDSLAGIVDLVKSVKKGELDSTFHNSGVTTLNNSGSLTTYIFRDYPSVEDHFKKYTEDDFLLDTVYLLGTAGHEIIHKMQFRRAVSTGGDIAINNITKLAEVNKTLKLLNKGKISIEGATDFLQKTEPMAYAYSDVILLKKLGFSVKEIDDILNQKTNPPKELELALNTYSRLSSMITRRVVKSAMDSQLAKLIRTSIDKYRKYAVEYNRKLN